VKIEQSSDKPNALPIIAERNQETVTQNRELLVFKRVRVMKEATGAAYADSLIFDKRVMKTVVISIKETGGAQSIYYKVLACIDPEDWHELQGETSLVASGHVALTVSDPWAFLKLQAKNNSGSGTVSAYMAGQTP
jgi:hypothetical protein